MKRNNHPFVKPEDPRTRKFAQNLRKRGAFDFAKYLWPHAFVWIAWCIAVSGCGAAFQQVVSIPDVRGDDHGPGTYTYPEGYASGAFDLTGVTLGLTHDHMVVVEVSFARRIPLVRGVRLANDLVQDVFLPTVDLYVDLDGVPGSGRRELLAGRRARLANDAGWELAVVLSPVPTRIAGLLATNVASASSNAQVWVSRKVAVRGNRLIARIPANRFGPKPLQHVGLAVVVSGTVYDTTFRTEVDDQVTTAFVREITREPGRCGRWEEDIDGAPCTFGGCGSCRNHPRLIDVLFPTPGHQEKTLGRYTDGPRGEVPLVYHGMPEPVVARKHVSNVRDRKGKLLTITLKGVANRTGLTPGKLLDATTLKGDSVGTVAVVSVVEGTVIVRVVEGDPAKVEIVRFTRASRL